MAEYDLISKTALLKHLDMAVECKDCPRNANKELYKCVHNPTSERCTCSDIAQICIRITEFATFADVQPIRRGKWDFQGYQLFKCTNCTKIYTQEQLEDIGENWTFPNFCPNCGADMREPLKR